MALPDFPNFIGPSGSNSEIERSRLWVVMLKKMYPSFYRHTLHKVHLWEKVFLVLNTAHVVAHWLTNIAKWN